MCIPAFSAWLVLPRPPAPRGKQSLASRSTGEGAAGNCITKPEVIFKIEQGEEPWILEERFPQQCRSEDWKVDDLIESTQENQDEHFWQLAFTSSKTLSTDSDDRVRKTLNLGLIINRKNYSRKKPDEFNVYEKLLLDIGHDKTPPGGKSYNQNKNVLNHGQDLTQSIFDQPFEYNENGRGKHGEAAFFTNKKVQIGETHCKYNECGRTFIQSLKLSLSQRTHFEMEPCECSVCGKSFYMDLRLGHQRALMGDNPYEYNEYGQIFCDNSAFVIHQGTYTRKIPHEYKATAFFGKRFLRFRVCAPQEPVQPNEGAEGALLTITYVDLSVRENPGASIPGLRVLKKQVLLESELRVNPPELDEAKGCRCRLRTGERWQGGGALRLELRLGSSSFASSSLCLAQNEQHFTTSLISPHPEGLTMKVKGLNQASEKVDVHSAFSVFSQKRQKKNKFVLDFIVQLLKLDLGFSSKFLKPDSFLYVLYHFLLSGYCITKPEEIIKLEQEAPWISEEEFASQCYLEELKVDGMIKSKENQDKHIWQGAFIINKKVITEKENILRKSFNFYIDYSFQENVE
ncbi:hypothetical protein MJG53_019261 [Ovis ammon polii x Ovis aries]|uniref:Uncharacterized protein n=1 Tax=Ovis ammon polii x Ovis aries TaxID=2918886 RepID=A0ACB9U2P7_9CETA|nr:hypothetical protein MJG53_019261 [Ovis ammon polii x Ovis aries]